MHETQLARTLLEVVLSEAKKSGDRRVLRVVGFIAETEHLEPSAINFHFQAHAQGTPAEGAELCLELSHVSARCKACGCVYRPDHHVTLCPDCGSLEGELLGKTGLGIESIDVD